MLWLAPLPARASSGVTLRWKPVLGADHYLLQIASDPAFARPVLEVKVPTTRYVWKDPPRGTFVYRVRSVDADDRAGPWSATREITLGMVDPPRLEAPPDRARITPQEAGATMELVLAGPESRPGQLTPVRFVVEISRDPRLAEGTTRFETGDLRSRRPVPGLGRFHWRAWGIDAGGARSAPTEARSFVVELAAPEILAPGARAFLVEGEGEVELRWSEVPLATGWEVTLRRGKLAPTLHQSPTNRLRLPVPPAGRIEWTVRGLGSAGEKGPVTRGRFQVQPSGPLLVAPEDGFVQAPDAPTLRPSWRAYREAADYQVKLARADGDEVVVGCTVSALDCELAGLEPGAYRWQVVARGKRGAFASAWRTFEVSAPELEREDGRPPAATKEVVAAAGPSRSTIAVGLGEASPGLRVGPQVGVLSTLSPATALLLGIRGDAPLPFLSHRLRLSLLSGFWWRGGEIPAQPGLPEPIVQRVRALDLGTALALELPTPALLFRVGVGPHLGLVWARVGPERAVIARPGGLLFLGGDRRLGPGSLSAELVFTLEVGQPELIELPRATLVFTLAYLLDL
ncbi:MAG: hypothetical protein P1V51_09825 [Deltaproteobacteria bacterium]|nr:hypothetical protein [Deltaproteobacteria bacterium]